MDIPRAAEGDDDAESFASEASEGKHEGKPAAAGTAAAAGGEEGWMLGDDTVVCGCSGQLDSPTACENAVCHHWIGRPCDQQQQQ
jgi:hypothetical protein